MRQSAAIRRYRRRLRSDTHSADGVKQAIESIQRAGKPENERTLGRVVEVKRPA
jgi:hypothetical protein